MAANTTKGVCARLNSTLGLMMPENFLIQLQLTARSLASTLLRHPVIVLLGVAFIVLGFTMALTALATAIAAPINALAGAAIGVYMITSGALLLRRHPLAKQLIPHFFLGMAALSLVQGVSGAVIAQAAMTALFSLVVFALLSNSASQRYFEGQ